MSYFKIGPTELRILLAIGNLVLLVHPMAELFGREYRLFDVGGVIATGGMAATLMFAAVTNTRALYAAEPLSRRRGWSMNRPAAALRPIQRASAQLALASSSRRCGCSPTSRTCTT